MIETTRRSLLGAASLAPLLAGAERVAAATRAASPFEAAFERLAAYAEAERVAYRIPGLTLSFRGPDGRSAVRAFGEADRERRTPMTPRHLVQIGSITKSFVGAALLRLEDQGRIGLGRPVLDYLPDAPLEDRRVTVEHLLTHLGGLPTDAPLTLAENDGRVWSTAAPGTRYNYSNGGYDLLGWLIAQASGRPFDAALRALVLDPLGMRETVPTIRNSARARFAKGYVPATFSSVWVPGIEWSEGTWQELDGAAGCVASTPGDMVRWLDFIAACASGRPQPLLSPAAAHRFATPFVEVADYGPDGRYGLGLGRLVLDGQPTIHHTGGMHLFTSAMTLDATHGGGGFASTNIGFAPDYRPRAITAYAVRLARALATNSDWPPEPVPRPLPAVETPDRFVGRYVGQGRALDVVAADGLALRDGGRTVRLRQVDPNRFKAADPEFSDHAFDFETGTAAPGHLWWGGEYFARGAAKAAPSVPGELLPLIGCYRSANPWLPPLQVVARGAQLLVDGEPVTADKAGYWRFDHADRLHERIWFGPLLDRRARWISYSGERFVRGMG